MHSAFGENMACECPYSNLGVGMSGKNLLLFEQTPSVVLI